MHYLLYGSISSDKALPLGVLYPCPLTVPTILVPFHLKGHQQDPVYPQAARCGEADKPSGIWQEELHSFSKVNKSV